MSPGDGDRLAALRKGLAFAGRDRRAMILAQIAALDAPGEAAGPADWRAARRALRQLGHEVKQIDGVVYVDGRRSDDPALAVRP